jgi:beta-lactam-binding protein with PASTA domain
LDYVVIGDDSADAVVSKQTPNPYARVEKTSGKVVLYVGEDPVEETVAVPNLIGMNAKQAEGMLIGAGLNVRFSGPSSLWSATLSKVSSQSVEAGTKVKRGTVITLTFGDNTDD